jgi:hypothetical protein
MLQLYKSKSLNKMKEMEKFDNYFKDQLAEHEITPPAGFWHQISEQLNHEESIVENTPIVIDVKLPFYKSVVKVAAIFAIALGIGSILYLQNDDKQEVVASKVKTTITPATPINNEIKAEVTIQQLAVSAPSKVNPTKKQEPVIMLPKHEDVLPLVKQDELLMPVLAQEESPIPVKANDEVDIQNTNIPVYSLKLLNSRVPENDEITVIEKNKKESALPDSKKVIIIEKNISKKPEIYFQVPLRF